MNFEGGDECDATEDDTKDDVRDDSYGATPPLSDTFPNAESFGNIISLFQVDLDILHNTFSNVEWDSSSFQALTDNYLL